ncbi:MAG: NUDIX domain-containing protein [Puniceicoccales bacterium]|jgi:8-oxo-dGTP pyrophosphatase MutT (NUDIX family)|nr:NUDIX domain-containing protein [Puniceicoccales bacterium]
MFTEKKKYRPIIAKIFIGILLFVLCHSDVEGVREEKINKIEVFVSAYCYRLNRARMPEILLLKRAPNRKLYPNLWECCGGSVRSNESFESAAQRQLLEEAGITATKWKVLECFEVCVNPDIIVPGLIFTCKADQNAVVKFDPREHVDFRWVTLNDLENFQLINKQMRHSIVKLLMIQGKKS